MPKSTNGVFVRGLNCSETGRAASALSAEARKLVKDLGLLFFKAPPRHARPIAVNLKVTPDWLDDFLDLGATIAHRVLPCHGLFTPLSKTRSCGTD
jgi:hypothetical protein